MKSFLFRLKFAWKNIIRNPGRSFVVFLTMFLSMALFGLILCLSGGLNRIFFHRLQDPYLNVDLTLTYDSNSSSRILNKRYVEESYSDDYEFAACFFNFYALTEAAGESFYSHLFTASAVDLERLINRDLSRLNPGEAFITETIAKERNLETGDTLRLFVSGQELEYQIKQIIPDAGLFTGASVFVNKSELTQLLFGSAELTNLGNIIYFDLKDTTDPSVFIEKLAQDPHYADFLAKRPADPEDIATMTTNTASVFMGVSAVALIALVVVLNSVFPLLFHDFRQQTGIIRILGGEGRFIFSIWVFQFLLFSVLAFPLGLAGTLAILNGAARVAGVGSYIPLDPDLAVLAAALFFGFMMLEIAVRFFLMMKKSGVSLSYDKRHALFHAGPYLLLGSAAVISTLWIFHPFEEKIEAPLLMLFGILAALGLADFLIGMLGSRLSRGKKPSVFRLFGARNLKDNLIIHNSVKVAMVSIVVIALTFTVRGFTAGEVSLMKETIRADYFLANIVQDAEGVREDILAEHTVDDIDAAVAFKDVFLRFSEEDPTQRRRAIYFISLSPDRISTYFNYDFDPAILEKFADSQTAYIALPIGVGKIFGLREGDKVTAEISREIPSMEFTVAGFFDTNYMGIMFCNLGNLEAYAEDDLLNTLFIIDSEGGAELKDDLMKQYSSRMYYLLDEEEMMGEAVDQLNLIVDFMSLLCTVIALGFLIVIVNNSLLMFYSLKNDYAKMKILGLTDGELASQMLREAILSTVVGALGSFLAVAFIVPNLGGFMLLGRYYQNVGFSVVDGIWRTLVGSLAFLLSYAFCLRKIITLRPVDEIKTF